MGVRAWVKTGLLTFMALSCRTPTSGPESSVEGLGIPTEEGVPISFISDLPAQVGHEIFKNIGMLVEASNPDGSYKNVRPIDVSITCEAASRTEHHCRMIYDGPEIRLKLADLFFQSMSGNVFVRRGCKGQGCEKPPLKMWWRTVSGKSSLGEKTWDFEVCDIRGLEAGVSVTTPFAIGNDLIEKINYKPNIKGFKASIVEASTLVPVTDDQGRPKTQADGSPTLESTLTYKARGLQAGFGPLGVFPTPNCLLKDDHEEEFFKNQKTAKEGQNLPIPDSQLEKVPGNYVKFLSDITEHMASESRGEGMNIKLKCQDLPHKPVCEMRYKGPSVTVPIPKYITGIFDGEVQVLRKCQNPGCKQQTEALMTMTIYQTDQFETIEMCSISGMEISTLKKLPFQSRIMGAPDIKGMIMRIDPGQTVGGVSASDPRAVSAATLKSLHMGLVRVGNYPTTRCQFVED